ncbi:response regulator [Haloarcula laminariae]|uniref:response regulator n=1 Tax=Haloarcula laminariae TaxID=2961577 RepID=UPI0024072B53|nr:response regulator [Halomicroarcula sp. FL173]
MAAEAPNVVVVDDEKDVADLHTAWLQDSYDVQTAYDGAEALEILTEDVSVVLLDREMPDQSGDDMLEKIRSEGLECRVAMVTGLEPEFDIIQMGFDTYLVKPSSKEELRATVERLLTIGSIDASLQKYFALASKLAVLEAAKSKCELESSREYAKLTNEFENCRNQSEWLLAQLDAEDYRVLFRDLDPSALDSDTHPTADNGQSGRPDCDSPTG